MNQRKPTNSQVAKFWPKLRGTLRFFQSTINDMFPLIYTVEHYSSSQSQKKWQNSIVGHCFTKEQEVLTNLFGLRYVTWIIRTVIAWLNDMR